MELVPQPTNTTCGQVCIAMITGKAVEEVIQIIKTDGPTSIGQLIDALDCLGIGHAEKNLRISKKNPVPHPYSILIVNKDSEYTHWCLLYDGKCCAPEFGVIEGEYPHGKEASFLAIHE